MRYLVGDGQAGVLTGLERLTVSHMAHPAKAPYAAAMPTGIWSRRQPFACWWCATSASYDMKYIPNPWNSLYSHANQHHPGQQTAGSSTQGTGAAATHRARVAPCP